MSFYKKNTFSKSKKVLSSIVLVLATGSLLMTSTNNEQVKAASAQESKNNVIVNEKNNLKQDNQKVASINETDSVTRNWITSYSEPTGYIKDKNGNLTGNMSGYYPLDKNGNESSNAILTVDSYKNKSGKTSKIDTIYKDTNTTYNQNKVTLDNPTGYEYDDEFTKDADPFRHKALSQENGKAVFSPDKGENKSQSYQVFYKKNTNEKFKIKAIHPNALEGSINWFDAENGQYLGSTLVDDYNPGVANTQYLVEAPAGYHFVSKTTTPTGKPSELAYPSETGASSNSYLDVTNIAADEDGYYRKGIYNSANWVSIFNPNNSYFNATNVHWFIVWVDKDIDARRPDMGEMRAKPASLVNNIDSTTGINLDSDHRTIEFSYFDRSTGKFLDDHSYISVDISRDQSNIEKNILLPAGYHVTFHGPDDPTDYKLISKNWSGEAGDSADVAFDVDASWSDWIPGEGFGNKVNNKRYQIIFVSPDEASSNLRSTLNVTLNVKRNGEAGNTELINAEAEMEAEAKNSEKLLTAAAEYKNVSSVETAAAELKAGLGDLANNKTAAAMKSATAALQYLSRKLSKAMQAAGDPAIAQAKAEMEAEAKNSEKLLTEAAEYKNVSSIETAAAELKAGLGDLANNKTAAAMKSATAALQYLSRKLSKAMRAAGDPAIAQAKAEMEAEAKNSEKLLTEAAEYKNVSSVETAAAELKAGLGDLANNKTAAAMKSATAALQYLSRKLSKAMQAAGDPAIAQAKAEMEAEAKNSEKLLTEAAEYKNVSSIETAAAELKAGLGDLANNKTAAAMKSATAALQYLSRKLSKAMQAAGDPAIAQAKAEMEAEAKNSEKLLTEAAEYKNVSSVEAAAAELKAGLGDLANNKTAAAMKSATVALQYLSWKLSRAMQAAGDPAIAQAKAEMEAEAKNSEKLLTEAAEYKNVSSVEAAAAELKAGLGDLANNKTAAAMKSATAALQYLGWKLSRAMQAA